MNIRWFDKVRSEDLWQRANQDPINTHIKKSSNGTHKAKEADDDLSEETQSQNCKSKDTTGARQKN